MRCNVGISTLHRTLIASILFMTCANYAWSIDPNCGPSSLLVIAKHFNIETTREEINRLSGYDPRQGTTLLGLSHAAEELGLNPVVTKLTMDDLCKLDDPSIVWVDEEHFFVVHGCRWFTNDITIEDTPNAPQSISKSELNKRWAGETIVFSKKLREQSIEMMEKKKQAIHKGPALYLEKSVEFWGTIAEGDTLSSVFEIINTGTEPLILNARSTCTCTAVILDNDKLMPGGKGHIKVIFDTENKRGFVQQGIYLRTNDPNNSLVSLIIAATVRSENIAIPDNLYLGEIRRGNSINRLIKILDPGDGTLEIGNIRTPYYIEAKALPAAVDSIHGRFIPVCVSMDINQSLGFFKDKLYISTTNQNSEVIVELSGTVIGEYRVEPPRLFWGVLSNEEGTKKEVLLLPNDPNSIPIKIGESGLPINSTLLVNPEGGYKLICSINSSASGTIKGSIPILSAETSSVIAEIPVYVKMIK